MAIDNLNYYSAWLPAGQQTDRYSSQPWCLRSKNLDIFSSSKSVKATAWSEPTTTGSDIVAQDGDLVLKTDWKIYENGSVFIDPNTNMPKYPVNYTWEWSGYTTASWGTPQDMVVKYEWNEWKSFVVFTDRASLTYSKTKYVVEKKFTNFYHIDYADWPDPTTDGYCFELTNASAYSDAYIEIKFVNPWIYDTIPIRLYAEETSSSVHISTIKVQRIYDSYKYDPELDVMASDDRTSETTTVSGDITQGNGVQLAIKCSPSDLRTYNIRITFNFTNNNWSGFIYVDMNWWPSAKRKMKLADGTRSDWDYNYYYSYLPLRERKLTDIWEYYWMKGATFQPLYTWAWTRVVANTTGDKKIRYDFVQYMWWNNDVTMDVIWMVSWNEQIYMVWNMNWNWYIFPCDLTGGRWTPYVAYGCVFKWVTNIDYLLYLVWEDRWVSQLWVYNGQELVSILWWNKESEDIDLVGVDEQYKFDWKMVEYRGNLVLSTSDGRILEYGQTYGWKWGTFIHEVDGDIKELDAKGNDLIVKYEKDNTDYIIIYQDDVSIKNYNTEWEATYPIVVWNHLLEKEESDLYASYILPSSDCSLEFWASANHYHFWTFKTDWSFTPTVWSKWMIDGTDFNYYFEFIEANWERLTFRLVWDLPAMTGQETMVLTEFMSMLDPHYISYTEFNHFRKIWEITTTGYQEWEIRFHNLNNKLELPKSHSLQVMVRGKGSQAYTPELFALDLVANQRERW